ncbi:flippase [Methanothermococcus okinawensis]|uniref:Polysaccharide biosynthesis protein n=1 Tax=Methanothermococcus okinawensis (strain DSM 14208 / JCM 11175 / IH1) TaxID=647113 RepID=F8ANS5_METOI|nr:flippase [Methanothermococcus okinawensis]AEH06273.1 polysaccharide biosynthesis protein [Methanothermococcus okinawensis IH1]
MLKNFKKFREFKNLKNDGLIRDSFYMIFSNIYSKGMAYIFYFLSAIILGTEGFGTLRGLLPLMDVMTIFFCSGIPPSMAKHISEYDMENHNEWIISILKIMIIFSIIGALITILLKYTLVGGYKNIDITLYLAVGFAVICSSFISWSRGVLQGKLKIKELSLTWVVEYTFKILFLVIFALLFGVIGALLSISFAYIIGGIAGYYLLKKSSNLNISLFKSSSLNKHEHNNNKNKKLVKKIILYAIPIALGTASYRLLNDLDSIFIMSILGAYDNGIYGYASLLSRGVFLFASAISIPLIPRIAKTKDFNYFKKAILMNFLIILPALAVVFIFSKELLLVFFGVHDYRASICLKILSISAGFMSSYTICSSSLQGLGYAKIPLYILLFGILLNGVLNYILINNMGIVGGAYATLISSTFIFLIILLFIYHIKKKTTK